MLASQALQIVLNLADTMTSPPHNRAVEFTEEEQQNHFEALTICTNILSVAVPIARFRCYVTIEKVGNRSKLGLGDFTVVGLDIPSIKNGLIGLSMEPLSVYAQLWEHKSDKFDMLSGYQGETKTLGFRNWLKDIDRHNEVREQRDVAQA